MIRILITNLIFAIAINVHSQFLNDTVYFNSSWDQSDEENAEYYRVISNDTSGKLQFHVKDYYKTGQIQMTGNYKSINPDYKLGKFYYYYKNGQLHIECNYYHNNPEGKYCEYFSNGQLRSEKNYKSGRLNGTELTWSAEGRIKKEVNYKNGAKHGKFLTYYDNGLLIRKDIYRDDKFVRGRCFTREGKDTSYFEYFIMPKFKGGLAGFKKYILDKINYPEIAVRNNEEGTVYVRFTVDKEGNIIKAKIVKEDKEYFNTEALRVLDTSPRWMPGRRDGKLIDVSITIPIMFKLN